MRHYVTIDIGASSGRVMLADVDKDLVFKEVHRFKNGFHKSTGHERWDIQMIYQEILQGLSKLKGLGVEECFLGIDTWAVDYCLIDTDGKLLAQPISYRDSRTDQTIDKVTQQMSKQDIYQRTGVQFLDFNTLFQLYEEDPALLKQTDQILMIPDYLTYLLTGKKVGEVTNASTTQLLNVDTREYDETILALLQLKRTQFPELVEPGTIVGKVKDTLQLAHNLPDIHVVSVATHDTASAIVGIPVKNDNWAYISSGTWSLIGVETQRPIRSKESYEANYTNEWGAYGTYRFLKNINGMWIVQEVARQLGYRYSYPELADMAAQQKPFQQFIDFTDARFKHPISMIDEIKDYCKEHNEIVPSTLGEVVMSIYSSLAVSYAKELERIERLTNLPIDAVHVVGGGSQVRLLNQLTADASGKQVVAGPTEGTALGNLLVQMIADNRFSTIKEARRWLESHIQTETVNPTKEAIQ